MSLLQPLMSLLLPRRLHSPLHMSSILTKTLSARPRRVVMVNPNPNPNRVFDSASAFVREGTRSIATTATPTSQSKYTGSCLCNTIQFTLSSPPFTSSICHCANCKKVSGSAFLAHAYFKPTDLTITRGKDSLRTYKDTNTNSGNALNRSFCGECGSTLFTQPSGREEDFIIVAPSAVEGSEAWGPRKEHHPDAKWEWVKEIGFSKSSPKSKL